MNKIDEACILLRESGCDFKLTIFTEVKLDDR